MAPLAPPLALTMGEPAGIGGEITLKAWLRRDDPGVDRAPPFVAIDDPDRLAGIARTLGLEVPVRAVASPAEAADLFAEALPVIPQPLPVAVRPGHPDRRTADATVGAIRRAVELTQAGDVAGLVTNPIHKGTLYGAGFPYPGHTEYLGALAGTGEAIMLLVCPSLRVVPLSVHLGLREALGKVTRERIVATGRRLAESLRQDFGVARPRIAVAGLNPHAGEGGTLGREEVEVIEPAIGELVQGGIDAFGPLAPDSMFHEAARQRYDAALCMYHDQALIPIKTIDFARGVNVTIGLPLVRTSPDHGTAFDIAGRGVADERSLVAALRVAAEIAGRRGKG